MKRKAIVHQLILLLFLLGGRGLLSQTGTFPVGKHQTLHLIFDRANITINGSKDTQLVIEATEYEAPPARAKGLRPLYRNKSGNTGLGLMLEEDNDTLTIRQVDPESGAYTLLVPDHLHIQYQQNTWMGDSHLMIQNMAGEVAVETKNSDISLHNVSGPVTALTSSGNIDVVFTALSQKGPSTIASISGRMNVSIPSETNAHLIIQTIRGNIHAPFDLQQQEKNGAPAYSEAILNKGGSELILKNTSGDIFLRKQH